MRGRASRAPARLTIAQRHRHVLLHGRGGGNPVLSLYWVGDTSADPTVAANWSATDGGGDADAIPDANDPTHFTGNGNNACTLTEDESWGSIDLVAGYTATLDLGTYDTTIANGGDVTLAGGGIFDMGSGTLSLTNGNFDNSGQTTFTAGTSTISFLGNCVATTSTVNYFSSIVIGVGASVTFATVLSTKGLVKVYGTMNLSGGRLYGASAIELHENAVVSGAGPLRVEAHLAGRGITVLDSTARITTDLELYRPVVASILAAGRYDSPTVNIFNTTTVAYEVVLSDTSSVSYLFAGDLTFSSSSTGILTVSNDVNNPDIEVHGNITVTGTITYTKGTGTLTASGASTQDWDFGGSAIEDVVVDKSGGTLTFSESCDPDSITQTAGAIAVTGGKTLTVAGNCVFNDDLSGVGSSAALTVTGTNVAHDATITNISCLGGTQLDATDNCTDGGGNVNVDFGLVAASLASRLSAMGFPISGIA